MLTRTSPTFRTALLLILAFTLGLGAQLLEAQVSTLPRGSTFSTIRLNSGGVINWNNGDVTLTHSADTLTLNGGVLVLPGGSVTAPSLGINQANIGFYGDSAGLRYTYGGTNTLDFGGSGLGIITGSLQWWSGTAYDVTLSREATATLKLGTNAAAPVAQMFKGADARAGTDTNTAGGSLTVAAGRGTGTAGGGKLILATALKTADSGTNADPLVNVASFTASGGHFILPQLLTAPSSPELTSNGEVAIFMKNGKFVLGVNRSGIVWYLSVPLDNTTTTWSWSTAAP